MSDEDKKDSGIIGGAAAIAAGAGAGYGIHGMMANGTVKKILAEKGATIADGGVIKGGSQALEALELGDNLLGEKQAAIEGLRHIFENKHSIQHMQISRDSKGLYTFEIGENIFNGIKKLPKGLPDAAYKLANDASHTVGPADIAKFLEDANKSNVENFLKGQQRQILTGLREATETNFLKPNNWGNKAGAALGAVATAFVAKVVFDNLFGGKHTDRVEAERAAPAAEPSRG